MRLALIPIVLLFLCWSCSEKIFTGDVDCDECYTGKPDKADLVIDLTFNGRYSEIPVTVYKGDVEDNEVISIDTAYSSPYLVYVPVDTRYSVKAAYKKGDVTLYAIDGTKLKLMTVSDACDEKCYIVVNDKLDARIKKDFLDF